jgi:hypothetical protein
MRLEIFQSDMGDCLLLEGADGRLMLIDGGMSSSYKLHVAPRLAELQKAEKVLDVVYVSHIDRDHISGVLCMLDDEVLWIEHEHHIGTDDPDHKRPDRDRTPKIKNIWHNAFHELVEDNEGEFEEMLAASAAVLSGADESIVSSGADLERVRALASEYADLATGYEEAIRVSRRVGRSQLNIKLNAPAKGKLMMSRGAKPKPFKLGGMKIHIIGPTSGELVKLREKWNEWLEGNKDKLEEIREQAEEDADLFKARDVSDVLGPKVRQARELISLLPLAEPEPGELGKPKSVTPPNVASLMLFVEEKGKTLLLTGDGRHEDITKGLERIGKLKKGGGLHVNVLKVQHHGSKNNIDTFFCQRITADHYLFCGLNGGTHSNPRPEVIEAVAASRLSANPALRSTNPEAGNPFMFHFSSSVAVATGEDKPHAKKVEKVVKTLTAKSGGQMTYRFLEDSFFELDI